ncbi:MAG: hypothetical protein MR332_09825 [Fusicatenibacter sp.]|nr:hypothetical protein [Fusicatenibacter sp.]
MPGDQKEFQNKLQEVAVFAKEHGGHITMEQVERYFSDWNLTREQLYFVCEYLIMEQIRVEDYAADFPSGNRIGDTKEKVALTREEELYLKKYEEELPEAGILEMGEREALFDRVRKGDDLAKSQATALYLPVVIEFAKKLHKPEFFIGDLIQEGNVALLLVLEQIRESGDADRMIRQAIEDGIAEFMDDMLTQKQQDDAVVGKVNLLKDAIEELSDGEEMNFSIEELSAYLDMSVEEIEDILRLTGEDA